MDTRLNKLGGLRYRLSDLGEVDVNNNLVCDINNFGSTVGSVANPATGKIEAFFDQGRGKTLLGTLGGMFSAARGINSRGEIVGHSLTAGNVEQHAFLHMDGFLYDLNNLVQHRDWRLMQAVAINDVGQIVGVGCCRGQDRIFLLTPLR